ncbi:MAG: rod shape-determining protein MreC [Gemmatimonadaceae bacterium]
MRGAGEETRTDRLLVWACVVASVILLMLSPGHQERAASAVRGSVVAPLAALQVRTRLVQRALTSYDSLIRLADSTIRQAQALPAVAAENAQLRALLGLGAALQWGFVAAEAVPGRAMGDAHTVVLAAGAQQGITPLSPVVAETGVIGLIAAVEEGTSLAIVWPHPDLRVSATGRDGVGFGIVSARPDDDSDAFLLELRGVPFRDSIAVGTEIVSSGVGGVFPRGIPIGRVVGEVVQGGTWSRTYLVQPAVRPADLTAVMVLTTPRVAAGVDSLWPAP